MTYASFLLMGHRPQNVCIYARMALLHSIWWSTGHQSLEIASWQHLCSAASHQPTVPPHGQITYGSRAFAVAGLSIWNLLPKLLRDPSFSTSILAVFSKHSFSWSNSVSSALEALAMMHYIIYKSTFYITLHLSSCVYAAVSVFLQLCQKFAIHVSFSRYLFWAFLSRAVSLWPWSVHCSVDSI